jgi:peptidoglycan/LPS O-acetylase OafA/YrhL
VRADRIFDWATFILVPLSAIFWVALKVRLNTPLAAVGITFADVSFSLVVYALIRHSGSNLFWVRVFRTEWLRSIGKVSYSLYLFHAAILLACMHLVLRLHFPGRVNLSAAAALLAFILSLGVAYGLWYGMESRILRWKDRKVPSPAHL